MPSAVLPKSLRHRIAVLGQRFHLQRVVRGACRIGILLLASALGMMLLDRFLPLPTTLRCGMLLGWIGLGGYLGWRYWRDVLSAPIDVQAVACAIEAEYPRLSERLTTAVELVGSDDPANGSPELIATVMNDAEIRTRKLDLTRAAPTERTFAFLLAGGIAALFVASFLLFTANAGETLRRFFLPWYVPTVAPVDLGYKVVITSGDPTVKRGESTGLAGYLEATRSGIILPEQATLIIRGVDGAERRLPMDFDKEKKVAHLTYGPIERDVHYAIESGATRSEWHTVMVIDPIRIVEAKSTITPPEYARQSGQQPLVVQGLAELTALQYSEIDMSVQFTRAPSAAWIEWKSTPEGDEPISKERTELVVDENLTARFQTTAVRNGTFQFIVQAGKASTTFPAQLLTVKQDEKPRFVQVEGVSTLLRSVKPGDPLKIACDVRDDYGVQELRLEYRVDDGPVQLLPLKAAGIGTEQATGTLDFNLDEKIKEGDLFRYRLVAVDNRSLPAAQLVPQRTTFPPDDNWAELRLSKDALPLKEQEIVAQKKAVEERLTQAIGDLKREQAATTELKRSSDRKPKLSPEEADKLDATANNVRTTTENLRDLAQQIAVAPDLAELARRIDELTRDDLKQADGALTQARREEKPENRSKNLQQADRSLGEALTKLENFRKENEQRAAARLDAERLERLKKEQEQLAEKLAKAKNEPAELERLQEQQKDLKDRLQQLIQESAMARKALDEVNRQAAEQLARKAEELEKQQRELNEALRKSQEAGNARETADLLQKQRELQKRAEELARKTASASRVGQLDPLKADSLNRAAEAIERGNLRDALEQQDRAAFELNRLSRDLQKAANKARDPREAADQLQRLQRDLRQRLADATRDQPLDQLPKEKREELAREQESLRKAIEKLSTPDDALPARKNAEERSHDAELSLSRGDQAGAEKQMDATAKELERLAEQMPSRDKRLAHARTELAKLRNQQETIARQAESLTRTLEKKDPDDLKTQEELAGKLTEAAKRQEQIAEQLSKLDVPGYEERRDRTEETLRRSAGDMKSGRPQDIAGSQQAAKRELERLEQALQGQEPADEKAERLARKQREIADQAAQNAAKPSEEKTQEVLQKQSELQRELDKLPAGDAAATRDDALTLTRKTENAFKEGKPQEAAEQAKNAAETLQRLAEQLAGNESDADKAERLAKKQKANANEAEQLAKKDPHPAAGVETRKKAQQVQDELKNLRPGPDAQKDKQKAMDALRDAQQAANPEQMARAQRQAAEALQDLAEKLSRNRPEPKVDEKMPEPRDLRTPQGLPSREQSEEARKLAEEQRKLRDQVLQAVEGQAGRGQQAERQLGKQQDALNREMDQLGQELEQLARKLQDQSGSANAQSKLHQAAAHMKQAQEALDAARQLAQQGKPMQSMQSREDAARALELAKQQANQASQQLAQGEGTMQPGEQRGDTRAGQALQQARDQMNQAGQQLGKGQQGNAQEAMQRASQALDQAVQQMRQAARSQPANNGQGQLNAANPQNVGNPQPGAKDGQNDGTAQGQPTLNELGKLLEKYPGKSWGDLPGTVKTEVLQEMASRYGDEYARSIKLYFEQLAERK